MTAKEQEEERILALCKRYFAKHGFMPDMKELCLLSGYTSKITVIKMLDSLERAGKIKISRTPKGIMRPRAYNIVGMKVRFIS